MTDQFRKQMALWGSKGGKARAKSCTAAKLSAIGRLGGRARAKAAKRRKDGR